MAKYVYGYTRHEVCDIATGYAIQLGKRTKENPFTLNWFNKFIKRWPHLWLLKSRGLEKVRAKSASASVVCEYFRQLEITLDKYNLRDKPHLIYNIDEKGVVQNHTPPAVVTGTDFQQAISSFTERTDDYNNWVRLCILLYCLRGKTVYS